MVAPPADPDGLRRAAALLEALHTRTVGGRWETTGLLASRPEVVARHADGTGEHVAEARARSAPWIVALGPELGEPLVAWLRATADAADAAGVPATTLEAARRVAATVVDRLDPG